MYTAPKSKIKSRVHYAPEPAWGVHTQNKIASLTSLRQLTIRHCLQLLLHASRAIINRYLLPAKPTAANSPQQHVVARWDRQTDGLTDAQQFHRPCSTHCTSSAKNVRCQKQDSSRIIQHRVPRSISGMTKLFCQ